MPSKRGAEGLQARLKSLWDTGSSFRDSMPSFQLQINYPMKSSTAQGPVAMCTTLRENDGQNMQTGKCRLHTFQKQVLKVRMSSRCPLNSVLTHSSQPSTPIWEGTITQTPGSQQQNTCVRCATKHLKTLVCPRYEPILFGAQCQLAHPHAACLQA